MQADAVFSVQALGTTPLRYQWRRNGSALAGEISAVLRLSRVQPTQVGTYDVLVYNAAGSVVSRPVFLDILMPATILASPQPVVVRPGTNVAFSVLAYSPGPITYQWLFQGRNISGATGPSYAIALVSETDDGEYSVVVTDPVGSVTTDPVRLTVLVNPQFIQGPLDQTNVVGGTVTFSVQTRGTLPMGYRWRRGSTSVRNEVLNRHTAFLTLTNVQPSDANLYSVIVTNQANYTPGVVSSSGRLTLVTETDGDHLPDDWETAHGLNPNDPADAAGDLDGDGFTNLQEYQAGTDPQDPNSYLKVEEIVLDGTSSGVRLTFLAAARTTYTVEFTESLEPALWQRLADVAARSQAGPVEVVDAGGPGWAARRSYRLVTPARR